MSDNMIPDHITQVVMDNVEQIIIVDEPTRPLEDGEFYITTLYSGISAGTELSFYLNTNPKATDGWDAERLLFRGDLEPDLEDVYPKHEGFMEVGEVTASRNDKYPVGMKVAGLYHHQSGKIASDADFLVPLPDDLDPILGIWVAKMGPISMNGILSTADELHRKPVDNLEGSLAGQRILVLGAGMIGLLCGIFAKWAGAKEVVIVDGIEERLAVAEKFGMVPMTADPMMAVHLKDRWAAENPLDTGADFVLQCTGSDYLLNEGFRCLREQGTVIDLGFYQANATHVLFGKEFHHNRLRHVVSQIGAMPRAQQRLWSRRRLSQETVGFLQQHGEAMKSNLITHIVPFSHAQRIFERLATRDHSLLQVVLHPDGTATAEDGESDEIHIADLSAKPEHTI